MVNKKGQALVEFIIILPIILFIMLIVIDFSLILLNKNRMENILNDVVNMYKNSETIEKIDEFVNENIKETEVSFKANNEYINVYMNKDYIFLTPGLSKIFGNDYKISVERAVYYEK